MDCVIYVEMTRLEADQKPSLWLCAKCFPNLANNWPTTSAPAVHQPSPNVEKSPAVDKKSDADRVSIAQHSTNLRLLESKLAESVKKIEALAAATASRPVPTKWGPTGDRADNFNRLIITNMPITREPLISRIVLLAHRVGCELRPQDIDHCNQIMTPHPSGATPVFVRFVQRWKRDEFYSLYLSFVNERALTIGEIFGRGIGDNRRIFVSEHLTSADNVIYKEARRMRKRGLIARVRTRNGCVFITPLGSEKEKYVGDTDALMNTDVQNQSLLSEADCSYYFDAWPK